MHLPVKQKLGLYAAGLIAIGGVSYVGAQRLRPDAPLSVAPISGATPSVNPAPKPVEAITPTPIAEPTPPPKEVVVAMAGAVKTPGLLHLPLDARVDDAIKRAGGAKADADLESINLAAKAIDGDQIYVPHKKAEEPAKEAEAAKILPRYHGGEASPHYSIEPIQPTMPPTLSGSLPSGRGGAKAKASGPVSLSTGSLAQLETLPGVGPATAQKILDYRMEHGGFSTIEEIQAVKGIGPKKYEKMKPFLKR